MKINMNLIPKFENSTFFIFPPSKMRLTTLYFIFQKIVTRKHALVKAWHSGKRNRMGFLSVVQRSAAVFPQKQSVEITLVCESATQGYVKNAFLPAPYKIPAYFQSVAIQERNWRKLRILPWLRLTQPASAIRSSVKASA